MRSGGGETDKAARNTARIQERRRELKTPREDREQARQEYGINRAKSGRAKTGAIVRNDREQESQTGAKKDGLRAVLYIPEFG